MLTADEAVEELRRVNYGVYKERTFGSVVREFTAMKNLPKPEFIPQAPLPQIGVDTYTK
jgi:hypothetical protein